MVETEYHGTLCFCRAGCRCAKHKNRRGARRVHMNDDTVPDGGMAVGNAATAANLSTLFTVEGASSPNAALFSTAGTDAQFSSPANGNVMIRVTSTDKTANNFFFRVRMK